MALKNIVFKKSLNIPMHACIDQGTTSVADYHDYVCMTGGTRSC